MKKIKYIIATIILVASVIVLSYGYHANVETKNYYQVYYKDKLLGIVNSKEELEKYIDDQSEEIKKKYKVSDVYVSSDINIKKIISYKEKTLSIENMYNKIIDSSSLTIDGYVLRIKREEQDDLRVYVLKEEIFEEAVNNFIYTYVGKDKYIEYTNNTQKPIIDTGSIVENVYIENDISIKKDRISLDEKIFTDALDLSQYLVFGNNNQKKSYTIKKGDTITSIAYNNQISIDEFLISNPTYTSANNLLMAGDSVSIGQTNPLINVVIESYMVEDTVNKFKQEIRYDANQYVGYEKVIQQGKDGLDRVSRRVKSVNGNIVFVEPISTVPLIEVANKIIVKGDKIKPHVGDLNHWTWPTNSGWVISSDYFYRINPVTGAHEHHSGIDIAGTGYNSPIYAANNGVIVKKTYQNDYGYYIIINHNNGYWTLYGHMSGFANVNVGDVVLAGQVIGYVGSTGWSTGPHLHFEVHKGALFSRINPWSIF